VWCLFRTMREACSLNTSPVGDLSGRRESMTTWGLLALAVFVCMGMGEWSKRMAASEVIVDEKVLQQAIEIAAERKMENRRSQMGNHPFSISQLPSSARSVSAGE
jgi:hypothetical protein